MKRKTALWFSGFAQRFKTQSLTQDDEGKFFYWVILPLAFPSLPAYYFIDNLGGDWIWRLPLTFFGPPFVLALGYISYCQIQPRASISMLTWMTIWPIAAGLLFGTCCFGNFSWTNALTGSKTPILVAGKIVEKKHEITRYTGKVNILMIEFEGKKVDLEVTTSEFMQYEIGSHYSQFMLRGGLGYLYRWR